MSRPEPTLLNLWRTVRDGDKGWRDLEDIFHVDRKRVEAAVDHLRAAKILQKVAVLFSNTSYVSCLPEAQGEKATIDLAGAAGVDLSSTW
jgi:hypothetical protein